MARDILSMLENATAITDAVPMSTDEMESLGAALIIGARAVRENVRLRAKIARMEAEQDRRDGEALARSQELVGLTLKAALTGVIVPAKDGGPQT